MRVAIMKKREKSGSPQTAVTEHSHTRHVGGRGTEEGRESKRIPKRSYAFSGHCPSLSPSLPSFIRI